MLKILVVLDGTGTAQTIAERLAKIMAAERLDAEVRTLVIEQVPGVRLQNRGDINEFIGNPAHLARCVSDTDILVVHLAPVDAATIAAAPRLKLIACARGGPQNVDAAAAHARGIPVAYCPGRNARAVAEFTIGMMILAGRNIVQGVATVEACKWQHRMNRDIYFGPELMGKTLGIIGFGSIGKVVADLAGGLGMRVLVDDSLPLSTLPDRVESADLPTLLRNSDFITLHARPGPKNEPLIGAAEFAMMKKTAILINTARGELIDERALREAILAKTISGAALDVLSEEPPSMDNALLHLPNVIITPHIAGVSSDTADWSARFLVEDVVRFVKGGEPARLLRATENRSSEAV